MAERPGEAQDAGLLSHAAPVGGAVEDAAPILGGSSGAFVEAGEQAAKRLIAQMATDTTRCFDGVWQARFTPSLSPQERQILAVATALKQALSFFLVHPNSTFRALRKKRRTSRAGAAARV